MPPLTDRATLARSLGLLAFDPSPETPGRRWRATDRGVRLTVGMVPGTSAAGPPRRARSIPDRVDFPESPARAAWATPERPSAYCESSVTPGLILAQSMRSVP